MADTFTKEERSRIMAKVRSKDTKPEVTFRRMLYRGGVRYRLHYPIDGRPDIAIPPKKVAVFIDGCFWHRCPKCFRAPASNGRYWNLKIERNVRRDRAVNRSLKSQGWRVVRAWEHEVRNRPEAVLKRVTASLRPITPDGATRMTRSCAGQTGGLGPVPVEALRLRLRTF